MSVPTPEEDPPPLSPEVERQALIAHVGELLQAMSLTDVHALVDGLAGAGTAQAVIQERRHRAEAARRQLEQQIDEGRRRDPQAWAQAVERVRRTLGLDPTMGRSCPG